MLARMMGERVANQRAVRAPERRPATGRASDGAAGSVADQMLSALPAGLTPALAPAAAPAAAVARYRAILQRLPGGVARQGLVLALGRHAGNQRVQRLVSAAAIQRRGAQIKAGTDAAASQQTKLDWPKVEALLRQSGRGNEALQIKDTYTVPVDLSTSGAPAYFLPDTGHCVINVTLPGPEVAAYFVHEMYHAKQFKEGKSPAAGGQDEQAWVKTMVDEEIVGTIKGFEAKLEMEKNGSAPKNDTPPMMTRYRGAYEYARGEALKAGKTEDEAHQAGLKNGYRMTTALIRPSDGSWPELAPNQFESYTMYYKREWRQKNLPKP